MGGTISTHVGNMVNLIVLQCSSMIHSSLQGCTDSGAMISMAGLRSSLWRLAAEAQTMQKATYIYNNGRNGNHLSIAHPIAEAIQVPVAGPDTSLSEALSAPFVEVQAREDNGCSSRDGEKTRTHRGKLHGEGPHICKVDGKVFRHRGDLIRHRKTKPGHAEYQGPVICVCRQEFSRRDGLHTHLKAKRCHGPLFASR